MKILAIFLISTSIIGSSFGTVAQPKTAAELSTVLKNAKAGDIIRLQATTYSGDFILPAKTGNGAITIDGGNKAVLSGKNITVSIQGGKYILQNLKIDGGDTSISIQGNGHTLQSLTLTNVQSQGIIATGSNNVLRAISVSAKQRDVGMGILVTGDNNRADHITIQGSRSGFKYDGKGNRVNTVSVTGGQIGLIINGEGNQVTGANLKEIGTLGIIIGVGNKNTQVQGAEIDSQRVGIVVGTSSTGGQYGNLNIKKGVFIVNGNDNRVTNITALVGSNITGCRNTVESGSIAKLYEANKCNTINPAVKIGERITTPLPTS